MGVTMSCQLTLVLLLSAIFVAFCSGNPLQPVRARGIDELPEPSGLTFCASTGTLFMISDTLESGEHLYNVIYELSSTGELLQKWTIVNHFDIEGITCDDKNKLIHILEEENMRVTTFTLPQIDDHQTYFPRNGKNYLLELHSFVLELGGFRENHPDVDGLEDLTWNPKTEEFLLSNANPALLISAG